MSIDVDFISLITQEGNRFLGPVESPAPLGADLDGLNVRIIIVANIEWGSIAT